MTRIRTNTATTQGIVVGTAYVVRHPEPEGEPHVADSATDALSERTRFERALARAAEQLGELIGRSDVFSAHLAIAEDPMLRESVETKIEEGMTAEPGGREFLCGDQRHDGAARGRIPARAGDRRAGRLHAHPSGVARYRGGQSFRQPGAGGDRRGRRTDAIRHGDDGFQPHRGLRHAGRAAPPATSVSSPATNACSRWSAWGTTSPASRPATGDSRRNTGRDPDRPRPRDRRALSPPGP